MKPTPRSGAKRPDSGSGPEPGPVDAALDNGYQVLVRPQPTGSGGATKAQPDKLGGSSPPNPATLTTLKQFVGRRDVYAVETTDDKGWRPVRQPLTDGVLAKHLSGELTVGTYPIHSNNLVDWICWDIDTRDMGVVLQLTSVLDPPFLVEDTGGRGRHVWQRFDESIPAADVLAYGLHSLSKAGVHAEVYPKQGEVAEGELGNLIRLPYGVHRKTGNRSAEMFGSFEPTPFQERTKVLLSGAGAGRYISEGPGGKFSALFDGDVSEWGGRNNALYRFRGALTNWLGVPTEVAARWCREVNEEYLSPPLEEDELERTVLR